MTLKKRVEELANQFAANVLMAIRGASLDEILEGHRAEPSRATAVTPKQAAQPRTKRGARPRTPGVEPATIEAALRANGKALRSEELRRLTGLDKRAFLRAVGEAIQAKRVTKTGEKRATTYRLV